MAKKTTAQRDEALRAARKAAWWAIVLTLALGCRTGPHPLAPSAASPVAGRPGLASNPPAREQLAGGQPSAGQNTGAALDRLDLGTPWPQQPLKPNVISDQLVKPVQYEYPAQQPSAAPADQTTGGAFSGTVPSAPPPAANWSPPGSDLLTPPAGTPVPLDIFVTEARTGLFTVGAGINSDAGVTGQIIWDERNFDITRWPRSWDDLLSGAAFRGAGQAFRLEAVPGNQVERYLVSFTEPFLFDTQVSMNVSGFLYQRGFFDWAEDRLGGRLGFGYRLTPDLSLAAAFRAENVKIFNPRVAGVPELDAALGDNDLFSGRITLTHDTRDLPFAPTEGHYLELSYEQVFGTYDYPRGDLDFRKYFLVRERPDGSGRHTLAYSFRLGVTGSQTPIFENYFAGGFSTLRGFEFRGASPKVNGVRVGGEFRFLGSVEYFFPLTADDMLKGVLFCDFGTVEEKVAIHGEDYRVAPGFGLRISVPALGPAPIALDFAVPVARERTDDIQNFSFFFGLGRG